MEAQTSFYEKNIEVFRTLIQDLCDSNYLSFLNKDKDTLLFLLAISYFALSKDAFIYKDLEETTENRLKSQVSLDWENILSKLPSFSYSPADMKSIEVVDSIRDSIMHGAINFDNENKIVDVIINEKVPYKPLSAHIPYEWFIQYFRTFLHKMILRKEYSHITCIGKNTEILSHVVNKEYLDENIEKLFSFVEFSFSSSKEFNIFDVTERTTEVFGESLSNYSSKMTLEEIEKMVNLLKDNPGETVEVLNALEQTKKVLKEEFGIDLSYTFKPINKEKFTKLINLEDGERIMLADACRCIQGYLNSMQSSQIIYLWMQRIMHYFDDVNPQQLSKYTEDEIRKIINPKNSGLQMLGQIEEILEAKNPLENIELQRDRHTIIDYLNPFLLQNILFKTQDSDGNLHDVVQIYSKELYIEEDKKRAALELKKAEKEKELERLLQINDKLQADEERKEPAIQTPESIRLELQEIDNELAGLKINQPNNIRCINGECLLRVDTQKEKIGFIVELCKIFEEGKGSINTPENGKVELVDYTDDNKPSVYIEADVDLNELLPKADLSTINDDFYNVILRCKEIQDGKEQIIQALLYSCFINCYVINKEKFDKIGKDSISVPDNMHSYAANMYIEENNKKKSLESKRTTTKKRLRKLEANRAKAKGGNANLEYMDKTIEEINQELRRLDNELATLKINDPKNVKCINGQNLVMTDSKEDIMRIIRNCFSHQGRVHIDLGEDNKVRLSDSSEGIALSAYIETDLDSLFEFLSQEAFREAFKKEEEAPVFSG